MSARGPRTTPSNQNANQSQVFFEGVQNESSVLEPGRGRCCSWPPAQTARRRRRRRRRRQCRRGDPAASASGSVQPGSQQDLGAECRRPRLLRLRQDRHHGRRAVRFCSARPTGCKAYPNVTVTIEGHCDERGTREYNLALGERRATAVKNVLVALGIPGQPRLDDQLRQGAAGGRRLERGGLCAEPPRRHGRQLIDADAFCWSKARLPSRDARVAGRAGALFCPKAEPKVASRRAVRGGRRAQRVSGLCVACRRL